ncbi:MAG: RNA-binding protein [Nitrospirota bacterium]
MGNKLYVGSIPFDASEESLRDLFSTIGEVISVRIITDAHTGRSKGFGFVEMASESDAQTAIEKLNGSAFMERTLIVSEARPQQPRERRGFGGGRGRATGGFGRGKSSGPGYGKGRR